MTSLRRENKNTENKMSFEKGNGSIQREKKIERKSVGSRDDKLDNTSYGILEGNKDLQQRVKIGKRETETGSETGRGMEMKAKRGLEEENNQTNIIASKQPLKNLQKQQILKKEIEQQQQQQQQHEQEHEKRKKMSLQSKLQTDLEMKSNFSVLASPGLNSSKVRRVYVLLILNCPWFSWTNFSWTEILMNSNQQYIFPQNLS